MRSMPNEAMTHAGRFHADDVFSAALLSILNPKINIIKRNKVPDDYEGLFRWITGNMLVLTLRGFRHILNKCKNIYKKY